MRTENPRYPNGKFQVSQSMRAHITAAEVTFWTVTAHQSAQEDKLMFASLLSVLSAQLTLNDVNCDVCDVERL